MLDSLLHHWLTFRAISLYAAILPSGVARDVRHQHLPFFTRTFFFFFFFNRKKLNISLQTSIVQTQRTMVTTSIVILSHDSRTPLKKETGNKEAHIMSQALT